MDQNLKTFVKGTTKSNGSKHELDKFYTKPEVVKDCLLSLNLDDFDCIIEPSAGNGAFSKNIKNCIAYDLAPEDDSIIQADWFNVDKKQFNNFHNTLVIGNPPFGVSGNLALRFIMEASLFANTIAFILPKSFKKPSIKNKIPQYFHLIFEKDLMKNSFTLYGKDYDVPCVFQIWEKKDIIREKIDNKILKNNIIEFCEKDEADFRIQRVGGNAGKASEDLNRSISSNYFVKNISKNLSNQKLISIINTCVFPTINDTVGPRSLAKSELTKVLIEKIEKL